MIPDVPEIVRKKLLPALLAVGVVVFVCRSFKVEGLVRYRNNEVYLTRYASIVTPGGVYGFAPGTKLTVDPTHALVPDKVFVTDGTHEMAIEPDALTHDADRARVLAAGDQQGQAMSAAAVSAAKARVMKVERAAQFARARDIDALNARQRSGAPSAPLTPAPTPTPPPLRLRVTPIH